MQPLIIEYCMSELTNDPMKEPVYSAKCNLFGKTLSHEIQAIFVKRYALKRSRNIGTVNIARKLRQICKRNADTLPHHWWFSHNQILQ